MTSVDSIASGCSSGWPGSRARALCYLPLLLAVLLAGCASTERFQQRMDSYLRQDIDRLREQFGYNYLEHELDDGLRVFTWTWSERGMTPGHSTPDVIHTYQSVQGREVIVVPGMHFPPQFYSHACEFSFIVDAQGRAVSWRAQGEGCAAYPGPGPIMRHTGPGSVQP